MRSKRWVSVSLSFSLRIRKKTVLLRGGGKAATLLTPFSQGFLSLSHSDDNISLARRLVDLSTSQRRRLSVLFPPFLSGKGGKLTFQVSGNPFHFCRRRAVNLVKSGGRGEKRDPDVSIFHST